MEASHLAVAIEATKKQLQDTIAELQSDPRLATVKKLHAAMNQLEDLAERPRTSIATLLDFGISSDDQAQIHIGPDEFFGLDALEAAKAYLRKVGPVRKSALFSDIVAGIHSGGADPGNEDKLRTSLTRSTFEVAKIGDDRYGLLEFFPHVKRGAPGRKRKADTTPAEPDGSVNGNQQHNTAKSPAEQGPEVAAEQESAEEIS